LRVADARKRAGALAPTVERTEPEHERRQAIFLCAHLLIRTEFCYIAESVFAVQRW